MFWSEQAVANSSEQPQIITNAILGNGKWIPPEGYKFVDFSDLSSEEISEFLLLNNNIGGDTTTLLSNKSIEWLKKWPTEWVGIRNEKNELIAFNFAIFLQCHLGDTIVNVGHTVYLCVHQNERGKGFAPVCIRETMRRCSILPYPIYVGYHQNDKAIGKNSIRINSWYRPLNHKKCQQLGMKIPTKGSHKKIRKVYSVNSPGPNFSWEDISPEDQMSLSRIVTRYPVRPVWFDFLKFFTRPDFTFRTIYSGTIPIGYVCYRRWPIYFKTGNKSVDVALIEFYFGDQDGLRYVFHKLAEEDYPFIYFHQSGPMTEELLKGVNSILVGSRWVNWYNWTGKYTEKDLLLPFY